MARKMNVLLVDDSRTVLGQMEQMLSEVEDLAVVGQAQDGAAAIRMTQESQPDLVLLDIVMPGLDGLSALRTIKSLNPDTHVAMVSSVSGDPAKAQEAFRLGAFQVLGKPFDREVLESVVEEARAALPAEADAEPSGTPRPEIPEAPEASIDADPTDTETEGGEGAEGVD